MALFDTYFAIHFVKSDKIKNAKMNELNGHSIRARKAYTEIVEILLKSKDNLDPEVLLL